jgi:hypothetical protein
MSEQSRLVEVFPRRQFDLELITLQTTHSETVARHVCSDGFGQALLLLRVHANAMGTSRSATLRCISEAPTGDDPDAEFLVDADAASLEIDDTVAAGTLVAAPVKPDFSYALRFVVDMWNGSVNSNGGGTIDLSADLLLRRDVTRPGLHREPFAYAAPDAGAYYVPFRSVLEGASISYRRSLLVPFSGRVERVSLYSASAPGTTTVAFHKNESTTATESVAGSWSAGEVTDFAFNSSARFDAGDRIHINVDPASNPGNVTGLVVLRLDNDVLPTQ